MSEANGGMRRAAIAASIGGLFAAGAFLHIPFFNGPEYWPWRWLRRHDALTIAVCFALAAAPALLALRVRHRIGAVALVALSVVAMQATALSCAGLPPLARLTVIVTDPASTSYGNAAMQVVDWQQRAAAAWVPKFDQFLTYFPMHARTKPLMPVAFYVALLRLFGASTPLAAAVAVAALSVVAVIAVHAAVRGLAGDDAALLAAVLVALMPAPAIFFPQLDVVYPLFSACVLATWPRALHGSIGAAAAFGVTVFAMSLASYSLLVLGAFCVVLAAIETWRARSLRRAAVAAGTALAVIVVAYAIFDAATGYPALAVFRAALRQQRMIVPFLHRPYPLTVPFDLLDFALGIGWTPVIAAIFFAARRTPSPARGVAIAGLLVPVVVALSGLLQAETARVWIFLMPFVALAAALEMTYWSRAARLLLFGSMIVVTIAVYLNMRFTYERVFSGSMVFRAVPLHAIR